MRPWWIPTCNRLCEARTCWPRCRGWPLGCPPPPPPPSLVAWSAGLGLVSGEEQDPEHLCAAWGSSAQPWESARLRFFSPSLRVGESWFLFLVFLSLLQTLGFWGWGELLQPSPRSRELQDGPCEGQGPRGSPLGQSWGVGGVCGRVCLSVRHRAPTALFVHSSFNLVWQPLRPGQPNKPRFGYFILLSPPLPSPFL